MSFKTVLWMLIGLLLLYGLFTVGLPFLLALVAALFLEPIILLTMRAARIGRPAASAVVCTFFLVAFAGLLYLVGLKVFSEFAAFLHRAPAMINEARIYLLLTIERAELFYDSLHPDTAAQVRAGVDASMGAIRDGMSRLVALISSHSFILARQIPLSIVFLIVSIMSVYLFSFNLPKLKQAFLRLFEARSRAKVEEVLNYLRGAVFGYFRVQLIFGAFTYIFTLLGLMILGVDYPLAIAMLVMILDIIPVFGPGMVFLPWALYALLVGNTSLVMGLLFLYLALTLFRRLVEPKILGDAVGIGALPTLISLYVGFKLAGVVGLFLGPFIVIIYQAIRKAGLLQISIKLSDKT